MRRIALFIIFILIIKSPSDQFDGHVLYANSKIYRIALLPICNPGMTCEPSLPKKLNELFFKNSRGVASYMHDASNGYAIVKGQTTDWLFPKTRLKSRQEVFTATGDLISLAHDQIDFTQFDIFIFYTRLPGVESIISWPPGQIVRGDTFELVPGLAFIFNAKIFDASLEKFPKSAIVPGTHWARALLDVLNLPANLKHYMCTGQLDVNACRLAPTPGFLVDEHRSLAFDWSINGVLNWYRPADLGFINQNGIYEIGRTKMPKTLEISLPNPVHFPHTPGKFDRLLIEFKAKSRWDRFVDSLNKNSTTILKKDLMSHVDFFLKGDLRGPLTTLTLSNQFLAKPIKIFDTNITMEFAKATDSSLTVRVQGYP
jgi:hypothetical protein